MAEVLEALPGARRALFRRYHIGGCSSCGFSPTETLAKLCARNDNLDVNEVMAHLQESHNADQRQLMAPSEVASAVRDNPAARLLDIRSREEWETAHIDGAHRLTQDSLQEIMGHWPKGDLLIICDHTGTGALDAAAYFQGHGFSNVRCLDGGVDAWARDIDPTMKRYRLD
ncbi:MAG: rhodanese-like domain-containing protein [Verrucomicrobiae bacterium]|nr:rhodanese-like domain-containing protein [Verrucomicrobiae bacterium]